MNELGKFLKILRINKNENLKKMSNKLNVSSSFLSMLENGKRKLNNDLKEKIIKEYKFNDNEIKEFEKAIILSNDEIKINLEKFNLKQKEIIIQILNSLENLDDNKIKKLNKIIKEMENIWNIK